MNPLVVDAIVLAGVIIGYFVFMRYEKRASPATASYYQGAGEALKWLRSNPNPQAFAANRFPRTEDAVHFVESLYRAGAALVEISKPCVSTAHARQEGGPYADGMVVVLPESVAQRKAVLALCRQEVGRLDAIFGGRVFLWWD